MLNYNHLYYFHLAATEGSLTAASQHLGVTLVRGRYFTTADDENSALVAVVNETFVRRFFKDGEEPLDRYFGLNMPEHVNTFRIVGIVRDAKFAGFALNRPARPYTVGMHDTYRGAMRIA